MIHTLRHTFTKYFEPLLNGSKSLFPFHSYILSNFINETIKMVTTSVEANFNKETYHKALNQY
ncbi:MAG: hypothetical protein ACJAS4_003674 [Bacteriovoracaceae bacterium]|jgi:hypothetical protein